MSDEVKRYQLGARSLSDTAMLFIPDVVVDAADYDRETKALRDENAILRAGMKGDYDLDAWLELVREKQAAQAGPCPTCGESSPFTGTCGTSDSDTRALCKQDGPR